MEALGAHAIDLGENPANWVLNVLSSDSCNGDLAESYTNSDLFADLKDQLAQWKSNPDPGALVSFDSEFACPARTRQHLANQRLATIYWRSPTYNRKFFVARHCKIFAAELPSLTFAASTRHSFQNGGFFNHIFCAGFRVHSKPKRGVFYGERNESEIRGYLPFLYHCWNSCNYQCASSHDTSAGYVLQTQSSRCRGLFFDGLGARKLW